MTSSSLDTKARHKVFMIQQCILNMAITKYNFHFLIIINILVVIFILFCLLIAIIHDNGKQSTTTAVHLIGSPVLLQSNTSLNLHFDFPKILNLTLFHFEELQNNDVINMNDIAHLIRNLAWSMHRHEETYIQLGLLQRAQNIVIWGTNTLIQVLKKDNLYKNKTILTQVHDKEIKHNDLYDTKIQIYGIPAIISAASVVIKSMNELLSKFYLNLGRNLFMKMKHISDEKEREELLVCRFMSTAAWLMISDRNNSEKYKRIALEIGAPVDETGDEFDAEDLYYQVFFYDFLGLTEPAYCHTLLHTQELTMPSLQLVITCLHQGEVLVRKGKMRTNPFTDLAYQIINKIVGNKKHNFLVGLRYNPNPGDIQRFCNNNGTYCNNKNSIIGGVVDGFENTKSVHNKDIYNYNINEIATVDLHVAITILHDMHIRNVLPTSYYDCSYVFSSIRPTTTFIYVN